MDALGSYLHKREAVHRHERKIARKKTLLMNVDVRRQKKRSEKQSMYSVKGGEEA